MITLIATILDLRFIPLYFLQSIINEPNVLWLTNQFSRYLDDLEKNHAPSKTKGVVGIPGKNTPRNPNPTKINPRVIYIYFFINFF